MKRTDLFAFLFVAAPFFGCAQTNACLEKTYAYSRSIIGGVAPVDAVEVGGKTVPSETKNNKEYFLYLQTCYVNSVTITSVWLNGKSYSAKAEKAKTPVTLTNSTQSSKGINETLVNKTSSSVWDLSISPDDTMLNPSASIQKLIQSNALVITGFLKGKSFTTSLKSLKELQPLTAQ